MSVSVLLRVGRLVGALMVPWFTWGCTDLVVKAVEYDPIPTGHVDYPVLATNKDVDVLFVIDNSGSMAEEQTALASAFGAFVEVLERPEVAANYRIGITTTDNGNPWCPDTIPEGGALRLRSCRSRLEEFVDSVPEACVATCPAEWAEIESQPTEIEGSDELRPRPWIESNEGRTNLPAGLDTTQAFQCLGPQGIDGCGFESQLESMWKALRRTQTDDDPAYGFIRSNAVLSVIHVTDEADCSYDPDWESIFLPEGNRVFWSNAEGEAPTSAVCWNAGVACEGASPYEGCHAVDLDLDGNEVAAEDADDLAVLRPVSRYVDLVQEIERHKQLWIRDQQVLVSVIGGVGADGSVTYRDAVDDPVFQQDFGIGPGCDGPSGRAVPPVRLRELAEAFAVDTDRNMFSSCEGDYAAALAAIAEAIADQLLPACMPACVADYDLSTPGLDPACTFTQTSPTPEGSFEELEIPPCERYETLPAGQDVCYVTLVGDERSDHCIEQGFNLELRIVRRPGVPAPGGARIQGDCALSQNKRVDCPDLQ